MLYSLGFCLVVYTAFVDMSDSESASFVMKIILQLAESGSFLGQVDLFKVRGKFALTDAYEDHFLLPKGKFLVVTHRRVILLQVSHMTIIILWHCVSRLKSTK